MALQRIPIEDLQFNPFTLINKEWMLITAGDKTAHNTMTASWGGLGEVWGHYVSTVYIRPQRHTFGFVDQSDCYSLCFFDETYRSALNFCGSKSGRDYDKPKECGLSPNFDLLAPYYEEAKMVIVCRKLYHDVMRQESFLDTSLVDSCYPEKDFHHVFVGEITEVLVNK